MISIRALVRLAAGCIAVLTTAVAVSGWLTLTGLEKLGTSSLTSASTFDTLHRTLDVTAETTGTIREAMSDLDTLVGLMASSSATTAEFVDDVADVTSIRISGSLAAIERAMPGLIEAGAVIDDTLSTLSLFGVNYRPEVPFDDALRDVQASLVGLAEDVADQGATLRTLVPEVERVGETSAELAQRIRDTRAQLEAAEVLLGEYREILTDTEQAVDPAAGPLRFAAIGRPLLIVIGLAGLGLGAALWQVAPRLEGATVIEGYAVDETRDRVVHR